jgi:TRAP-type C4-dicarboxylate transport system permease small subunit
MILRLLPSRASAIIFLILLALALLVLVTGLQFSLKHVKSGWLFSSSTLPIKLAWMYMSLTVGLVMLISVNIELILRALLRLVDPERDRFDDPDQHFLGAE